MSLTLPAAVRAALQFEECVLENGLTLRVLPMPEYNAVHAIYATGFGSIDRAFAHSDAQWTLPAGVAHFLEHKMFENEDGVDAFSLYAATGASGNAYTGFDRTSYVFTAADNIDQNLDILLSFVSRPHFTAATVQKEQGIIAQEIKMYEDNAPLRALYALLEGLYHAHPLRDDIAGTVESIADITPEMLYACCGAFYTPGNMVLAAAGNITMQQLKSAVERAGLPAEKASSAQRIYPPEPMDICRARHEFSMPIALPMLAMGFKEAAVPDADRVRTEALCEMLTELVCGESSPLYRRLYDEGLIQPEFSGEYEMVEGALCMLFSGAVSDPQRVQDEVLREIARLRREGIDPEQFELCKNMMYGAAVCELDNVERMAYSLASGHFRGCTPEEEIDAIAALGCEKVTQALQTCLQENRLATVIVWPQDAEGTE